MSEWRRVRLKHRPDCWSRELVAVARRKPGRPDVSEIVVGGALVNMPCRLAHAVWQDVGPVPAEFQQGVSDGLAVAYAAAGVTHVE